MSHVIAELEKSISRYKEEYASLISQAQAIKADLAAVEAKVRSYMSTNMKHLAQFKRCLWKLRRQ